MSFSFLSSPPLTCSLSLSTTSSISSTLRSNARWDCSASRRAAVSSAISSFICGQVKRQASWVTCCTGWGYSTDHSFNRLFDALSPVAASGSSELWPSSAHLLPWQHPSASVNTKKASCFLLFIDINFNLFNSFSNAFWMAVVDWRKYFPWQFEITDIIIIIEHKLFWVYTAKLKLQPQFVII